MRTRLATALLAAAVGALLIGARHRAVSTPSAPPVVAGPTFNKEVVRIFQQSCQTCHHPGDIAPFSLMTYAEAKAEAPLIKFMTQTHQMPPWKPTAGCGDFADARTLSQADIDTLAKWVENGAPEGNPADLPPPIQFTGNWSLGQPDMILQNPEAYQAPADGDMYRCFTLPTNLTQDAYVSAIDIHPGDATSVHHVIAYIDTTGESVSLDAKDPGPGYTSFGGPGFSITNISASTLGGWAPGYRPTRLPEEVAYLLPAASRVVLQVHYHPHNGPPKPDQTQIGIYFAKKKPQKLIRILPLINTTFTIPPNDPNYKVTQSFTMPVATHLWLIAPHMHLLGKSMNVRALVAGVTDQCLINIDDWDYAWQGLYRFKEPLAMPAFTKFSLTATYDNSSNNPRNPNDPPKPVSWGEQTTDEMCIAFIGFTVDSENLQ